MNADTNTETAAESTLQIEDAGLRPTLPCGTCGARVVELRRGRCWGCYSRWEASRPVGRGAACAVCRERRRSELRLVEVHQRSWTLCHSCAGRVAQLEKVPPTVREVRQLLTRERRAVDRRNEASDRRIFPRERRVGERRGMERDQQGTDPRVALPDFDEIVVELEEADIEAVEMTQVKKVDKKVDKRANKTVDPQIDRQVPITVANEE